MTVARPVPVELLRHLRRARDHIDRHYRQQLAWEPSGNWLVLVEAKEFTPADFT